jgi:transcriptional regulator NrdR family protein
MVEITLLKRGRTCTNPETRFVTYEVLKMGNSYVISPNDKYLTAKIMERLIKKYESKINSNGKGGSRNSSAEEVATR